MSQLNRVEIKNKAIINQIKESGLLVEQQQKILGNNAMQLLAKLNSVDETQIYEFQ